MNNQYSQLKIRKYTTSDKGQVLYLWESCNLLFPGNDPVKDIELKVSFQPDLFLVGEIENKIVATLMTGFDGHRGWLNYLGVLPEYQKRNYGKQMVVHASNLLKDLGCPKINLQIRNSNSGVIDFYKKIGFIEHDVKSMQFKL